MVTDVYRIWYRYTVGAFVSEEATLKSFERQHKLLMSKGEILVKEKEKLMSRLSAAEEEYLRSKDKVCLFLS